MADSLAAGGQGAPPVAAFTWSSKHEAWIKRLAVAADGADAGDGDSDAGAASGRLSSFENVTIHILREPVTLVGSVGYQPIRSSGKSREYCAAGMAGRLMHTGMQLVQEKMPELAEGSNPSVSSSAELGDMIVASLTEPSRGRAGQGWEQV